ncbi:hypothetical protein [Streptomyces himalayensis]|uniref:Uncharacterized protein n=1 Tax=Streptomyces himalayensis subsp. himalayensis TaxID=2756131 RepID=A0A7W0DL15_9ACTN|nr:hypothetical protein [Streptomyces himalayensis]MBA2947078.1 hypothetical protein [Streptomyces himalayensis subsp. himalayensis]
MRNLAKRTLTAGAASAMLFGGLVAVSSAPASAATTSSAPAATHATQSHHAMEEYDYVCWSYVEDGYGNWYYEEYYC